MDCIRVFVGGTPEHRLPFDVLAHSIRRHTTATVQVRLIHDLMPVLPVPQSKANRPATSFSLQRFAIPELCGFAGKGIYLDSDMIVRADIRELWETPFPAGARVLAPPGWQTAVLLWDAAYRVTVGKMVRDFDNGSREYRTAMNGKGLKLARAISPLWNCTDRYDEVETPEARLIHFTSMNTQPWLRAGHPHESLWLDELKSAIGAGAVMKEDVLREIELKNVRPSLTRIVGDEPLYLDRDFVFPDDRRA